MIKLSNLRELVLGVILNKEGKVLIIQRAQHEKGTGGSVLTWAFPGGTVEKGELREDRVVKEVFEETGFKVGTPALISERAHPQFPVHIFYFGCQLLGGKAYISEHEREEVAQVKWVHPSEVPQYFTSDLDGKVAAYLGLGKTSTEKG